jgi:hypothetical protein
MVFDTQNYWGYWSLFIVRYSRHYVENTTFLRLDLFPSSGEGLHLLCWVP